MQKFQHVLLDVWREACRHIDIAKTAQTIAPMLLPDMPLGQILIRSVDPRRESIDTIAVGFPGQEFALASGSNECSPDNLRRLRAWAKQGDLRYSRRGDPPTAEMKLACPTIQERDLLVAPLRGTDGALGLLIFVACEDQTFTKRHRALAQVLLDPFSAALAGDQRLREMASLREAAEAENQSLLRKLGRKSLNDAIVGEQTGLRDVMGRVELVARSDVPVLIFGDTGTGKELIARTIHLQSARAQGPVLRVNCGAIPPELIDSELFGHQRGAFTGAVESRKGWFERADGGTLFLDEVGELPLAAQVRLLRILQDGWLERVGGEEPIHVDVRVIAATHRDLAAMVARGEFRADLWYRISVFPLVLPPLAERQQDIAELAAHFARRAATRFGLAEILPSPDDIRLLTAYSWPGNIRELAAVIDRAAILGNGRCLEIEKALGVSDSRATQRPAIQPLHGQSGQMANENSIPIAPLDRVIQDHIEAALKWTAGRVEGPRGAAALLAINPNTLRGRMRKMKIDWREFRE